MDFLTRESAGREGLPFSGKPRAPGRELQPSLVDTPHSLPFIPHPKAYLKDTGGRGVVRGSSPAGGKSQHPTEIHRGGREAWDALPSVLCFSVGGPVD